MSRASTWFDSGPALIQVKSASPPRPSGNSGTVAGAGDESVERHAEVNDNRAHPTPPLVPVGVEPLVDRRVVVADHRRVADEAVERAALEHDVAVLDARAAERGAVEAAVGRDQHEVAAVDAVEAPTGGR